MAKGKEMMTPPKKYFQRLIFFCALSWLLAALVGCSLLPTERQKSEAVKASEQMAASHNLVIKRALESGPEIARTNSVVKESLTIESTSNQNAGSKEAASGSSAVSIPMGVKIGLLAVGIGSLVGVLTWAWRSIKGTAFGAGLSLGNAMLKNRIDAWREHAMTATDPREIAEANAEIASLEADRGRLMARR